MATGAVGTDMTYRNFISQNAARATDVGTGTAVAGAATLSAYTAKITTEALTTAAAATYTLTITDDKAAAADVVLASIANGTNSAGGPTLRTIVCGAGTVTAVISNEHATNAFNGTLVVSYQITKAL